MLARCVHSHLKPCRCPCPQLVTDKVSRESPPPQCHSSFFPCICWTPPLKAHLLSSPQYLPLISLHPSFLIYSAQKNLFLKCSPCPPPPITFCISCSFIYPRTSSPRLQRAALISPAETLSPLPGQRSTTAHFTHDRERCMPVMYVRRSRWRCWWAALEIKVVSRELSVCLVDGQPSRLGSVWISIRSSKSTRWDSAYTFRNILKQMKKKNKGGDSPFDLDWNTKGSYRFAHSSQATRREEIRSHRDAREKVKG